MKQKLIFLSILIISFSSCADKGIRGLEEFPETKIPITLIERSRGDIIVNDTIGFSSTYFEKPVYNLVDYEKYWLYRNLPKGDTIMISNDLNEIHTFGKKGKRVFKRDNVDFLKKKD